MPVWPPSQPPIGDFIKIFEDEKLFNKIFPAAAKNQDEIPDIVAEDAKNLDSLVEEHVADFELDGKKDGLEHEMSDSISKGSFDLRGKLGRLWTSSLKKDPHMKESYLALGKSYNKQREFRKEWLKDEHHGLVKQRLMRESLKDEDETEGTYEPFSIIVQREGGDAPALTASRNYVFECVRLARSQKTCNGRPWLSWNQFTKRVDILYLKKKYRNIMSQAWMTETKQQKRKGDDDKGGNEGIEKSARTEPKTPDKGGDEVIEKTEKKEENEKAGSIEKKPKKGKRVNVEPKPEKSGKTELNKHLSKAVAVKARLLRASGAATDVFGLIASDSKWSWANHDAVLGGIRASRNSLEEFKTSSPFAKAWTVEEKFPEFAKKTWSSSEIAVGIEAIMSMEPAIAQLEKEVTALKQMHSVRMGIKL